MLLRLRKLQVMQNLRYHSLPGFSAVLVACFFFMAGTANASEQLNPKQYYDANSITLGGDAQEFTIGKGQAVKISAGHSIHLLPGTHIEAGGQVVVEVRKDAKPEKAEESTSVMLDAILPASPLLSSDACNLASLPDNEQKVGISAAHKAILPVQNTSNAKNLPFTRIIHEFLNKHSGLTTANAGNYLPVLSWGERPETIKVLRT
jgi:hypothetical protein